MARSKPRSRRSLESIAEEGAWGVQKHAQFNFLLRQKRIGVAAGLSVFSGMTVQEIKLLPVGQKLVIMEAIWDDMRERFESIDLSPEQKALLDHRRERVRTGDARLLDWDTVKSQIGKA